MLDKRCRELDDRRRCMKDSRFGQFLRDESLTEGCTPYKKNPGKIHVNPDKMQGIMANSW